MPIRSLPINHRIEQAISRTGLKWSAPILMTHRTITYSYASIIFPTHKKPFLILHNKQRINAALFLSRIFKSSINHDFNAVSTCFFTFIQGSVGSAYDFVHLVTGKKLVIPIVAVIFINAEPASMSVAQGLQKSVAGYVCLINGHFGQHDNKLFSSQRPTISIVRRFSRNKRAVRRNTSSPAAWP